MVEKHNSGQSNLLINEPPLQVLPSLAEKIGLNEAIIIQQIHYWLNPNHNNNFKNNKHWVHNTYKQWQKQFKFWSLRTIRRTIKNLEDLNLLTSSNFNNNKSDHTKWYTIDYDCLNKISKQTEKEGGQIGQAGCSNWTSGVAKLDASNNKDTETTTETTLSKPLSKEPSKSFLNENKKEREMIDIWEDLCESSSKTIKLTAVRKNLLSQRLKEHFMDDINNWQKYCSQIASSKFLMGEVTAFKASLDWCLKEEIIQKIEEGQYGVGDRISEKPKQEKSKEDLLFELYKSNDSDILKK